MAASTMDKESCDMYEFQHVLQTGAGILGITVSPQSLVLMARHYHLVCSHNRAAGLTAITDPVTSASKHYLDSITALLAVDFLPGQAVADIGSGAGFPGIVLAIMKPETNFLLVESNRKRADFLYQTARELALANVHVVAARAELLGNSNEHREHYDLVVSRAVAPLPVLLEYCLPLVRIGGTFLAMKGPAAEEEIPRSLPATALLGGALLRKKPIELPGEAGHRLLITFEKKLPTPSNYPRRPGLPSKRPLT